LGYNWNKFFLRGKGFETTGEEVSLTVLGIGIVGLDFCKDDQ
jgi:hypothetical protein